MMAVQARRCFALRLVYRGAYQKQNQNQKHCPLQMSQYCTGVSQNEGCESLLKLQQREENDVKKIVQSQDHFQRWNVMPHFVTHWSTCNPFKQWSGCLTSNSKRLTLLNRADAGLSFSKFSAAICPKGLQTVRHKSGGKSRSSSSSSDEESDLEELDDDDYEAPTNFKKMQIYLKSLRADSVVSSALDISRNRVDEIFFGSRLRLNGEKLLKKSKQMDEGDYVDLITERLPDEDRLLVKRVKIISISPERTNKDKIVVTVKAWKSPFPIEDASSAE